jgi:hypothetical protein
VLDKVPAPVRHLLIVAGATFLGAFVHAILSAQGVTGVDWAGTAKGALNLTAVNAATAVVGLWLTPLTRQYGVGSLTGPQGD